MGDLTEKDITNYIGSSRKVDPINVDKLNRIYLLKTAVMVGDFDLVEKCIKLGVDVSDNILIENSSYYGYYDIVKILLENGANPNGNGGTLLLSKARKHYKTYKLLNQYLRKYKLKQLLKNIKK